MLYQEGGIIISKKQHACGSTEWLVARTGADIKLKCKVCNRVIFVSVDQARKMTKNYIPSSQEGKNE